MLNPPEIGMQPTGRTGWEGTRKDGPQVRGRGQLLAIRRRVDSPVLPSPCNKSMYGGGDLGDAAVTSASQLMHVQFCRPLLSFLPYSSNREGGKDAGVRGWKPVGHATTSSPFLHFVPFRRVARWLPSSHPRILPSFPVGRVGKKGKEGPAKLHVHELKR